MKQMIARIRKAGEFALGCLLFALYCLLFALYCVMDLIDRRDKDGRSQ
jgi:hypothetical protein